MKKVIKYVLLYMCVLALVLQPVAVLAYDTSDFADIEYTNDLDEFTEWSNSLLTGVSGDTGYFTTTWTSDLDSFMYSCISSYAITSSNTLFIHYDGYYIAVPLYDGGVFDYVDESYVSFTPDGSYVCYRAADSSPTSVSTYTFPGTVVYAKGEDPFIYSPYLTYYYLINPLLYTHIVYDASYSGDDSSDDDSSSDTIPDVTPDPDNPTDNGSNYPMNIYYQIGLWLAANFRCYTPSGYSFNSTWVGVGQELTYEYLCKTNMDSETVTLTLSDGSTVTVDNYLYGTNTDYSSNLANIYSMLSSIKTYSYTIASRLNTTNSRLSNLDSDINDQMDETQAKLDEIYPEEEIEINNTIADTVTDDSTGHGLTATNISNGKDAVDEGISTFELDTSGSSYTSPFSALSDSDWSFWTETTYDNLGSGYSFDEAELMDEDTDVFDDQQTTLLDLLGW